MKKYSINCQNIEKQMKNISEIDQIKKYLANNFISCVKYNNQLDTNEHTNKFYEAIIELSKDF